MVPNGLPVIRQATLIRMEVESVESNKAWQQMEGHI